MRIKPEKIDRGLTNHAGYKKSHFLIVDNQSFRLDNRLIQLKSPLMFVDSRKINQDPPRFC